MTKVSYTQVTAERNGRKRVRNLGKCKILKERPGYLRDKDCKDVRRQTYESDFELSDFDLVTDEIGAPIIQAVQPIVQDRNQVEERQDIVLEERQVQEDLFAELGGTGTEGSSEDEGEVATRRSRRIGKKPDLYGDWEYEREEISE